MNFLFETYLIICAMTTYTHDALDAVLDAASAAVADLPPPASSTPLGVSSAVSKSQFVSFDDVLSDSCGGGWFLILLLLEELESRKKVRD